MHLIRSSLLLCALLVAAVPATAAEWPTSRGHQAAALAMAQQDGPSLSEAIEQVRRQYRGRIVSATTQTRGNREVHVIKVLTEDGKVKTVRISGRTRGNRT